MGGLGGGHYTAYCLNHITQKWYSFNDSIVSGCDVSAARTSSAYLLFYQRREPPAIVASPPPPIIYNTENENENENIIDDMTLIPSKSVFSSGASDNDENFEARSEEDEVSDEKYGYSYPDDSDPDSVDM